MEHVKDHKITDSEADAQRLSWRPTFAARLCVSMQLTTRCSAIAERPRCRVRNSFCRK